MTFKIDPENKALWDKYSPEKFPVITWKSAPRAKDGKDTGSIYVFPRTSDGIIKIGYRGVKVACNPMFHPPNTLLKLLTLCSLPILKRRPTGSLLRKTVSGRFLYRMTTARPFRHKPRKQSGPLCPSSCQSLTRPTLTRPSCAGTLTPWTTRLWSVAQDARRRVVSVADTLGRLIMCPITPRIPCLCAPAAADMVPSSCRFLET